MGIPVQETRIRRPSHNLWPAERLLLLQSSGQSGEDQVSVWVGGQPVFSNVRRATPPKPEQSWSR